MGLVLFSLSATAQLGAYNFTGSNTSCGAINLNVDAQPANAVFAAFKENGLNCVPVANVYATSNHPTSTNINTGRNIQFTITPNTDYRLTLTSLRFSQSASAVISGAFWYLRSSLDNYTTNIASGDIKTGNQNENITLPAATFTNTMAVTFRLYAVGLATNTDRWVTDKVELYWLVNQIPPMPTTPTSDMPRCSNQQITISVVGSPPNGNIEWWWQTDTLGTSLATNSNTYRTSVAGTYYLRARDKNSLLWSYGSSSISINFTPDVGVPVFDLGANSARCEGAGNVTYTSVATDATKYTYRLDGTSRGFGNSIDGPTGTVTFLAGWTGTSIIEVTAEGCGTKQIVTHTNITNPQVSTPVFSSGSTSTRCQGAASVTYSATATNTAGIVYSIDAASVSGGNSINSSTGALNYAAGWFGTTTITATANGLAGCTGENSNACSNHYRYSRPSCI